MKHTLADRILNVSTIVVALFIHRPPGIKDFCGLYLEGLQVGLGHIDVV